MRKVSCQERVLFLTFTSSGNSVGKYASIEEAGKRLLETAQETGLFTQCERITWRELTDFASKQNLRKPDTSLNYLFTPYLFKYVLSERRDFDYILYAGAGCEILDNHFARKDFYKMISLAEKHGVYAEGTRYLERAWTKQELVDRINPRAENLLNGQAMATFILVSLSRHNLERVTNLIEEWFQISSERDFFFIRDDFDPLQQNEKFIAHRNDQSVLSLLLKEKGFDLQKEVKRGFGKPFPYLRGATTFLWLARNRTGTSILPTYLKRNSFGLISWILSPLFLFYNFLQDRYWMRSQYSGFPKETITSTSDFRQTR